MIFVFIFDMYYFLKYVSGISDLMGPLCSFFAVWYESFSFDSARVEET